MFEAKPLRPSEGLPLRDDAWDGNVLRELTWSELVARLAASRQLRGEFHGLAGEEGGEASFDASSARRIAALHSGDSAINLEDSGYRKEPGDMGTAAVKGAGFDPGAARKA